MVSAWPGPAVAADAAHDPRIGRVEAFHDSLVAVMQLSGNVRDRQARLAPAVDALFDIDNATRMSVGRPWRDLDEPDRSRLRDRMRRLIVATYASRFDTFRGQTFRVVEGRSVGGSYVVRTRLERPEADSVSLDYYFRDTGVFNVVADGVSDVALRRTEYSAVLEESGVSGLLDHLDASIAALAP